MENAYRPRRTCLSVPGSSLKMIEKARAYPPTRCSSTSRTPWPRMQGPGPHPGGRGAGRARLGRPAARCAGERLDHPWTHTDVIDVVSAAGAHLDVIVLPKVTDATHVHALDLLLTQLERTHGLPVGRIGVDAQIEDAKGLNNIDAIARAPRVQALVLGPADLMASLNMRTLVVGEQPEGYDVGDAYHHVLMTILVAARAHGLAAVDGPYLKVRDVEAFRRVAGRSAALGYDGKWVLHPDQIAAGNEIFSRARTSTTTPS